MPWNHDYSPLDYTIDALQGLSVRLERAVARDEPLSAEELRGVMVYLNVLIQQLKPLQEFKIQEQR